jgi:hypothetical protein
VLPAARPVGGFLTDLRAGSDGVGGVVQVGLEITDDRAEKAPGEEARPEWAIGTLADRRQLTQRGSHRRPSCQRISSATAPGRSGAASPAALAA